MSIKSLIASAVLLGSSAAAFASPIKAEPSWTASSPPIVRDHREGGVVVADRDRGYYDRDRGYYDRDRGYDRDRYDRNGWNDRGGYQDIVLSSDNRISDDYQHRAFVNLNNAPPVRELTLQSRGRMLVDEIAVEYWDHNGTLQTVKLRPQVAMNHRNNALTFDLGSRVRVNRIIVYGANGSQRTSFDVIGR